MIGFKINEKKLLDLLQELIKIESINPSLANEGSGESAIADYIGNYLKNLGLEIQYQKLGEKRKNIVGILKGSDKGQTLMLNGHTDTVSAKEMEIEPFNPSFENGQVYGRGSLDMKSGLAAMIMAIQSIIESDLKLKGTVVSAFVADEEYASMGTEELIKGHTADAAIICEPSNLLMILAHKGFAWIKVDVHGKAAHGSLPSEGIDAIAKAGKFLVKLEDLEKKTFSLKRHELLGFPSIHASLINGGIELSTYPDHCKIELERRTLPGENRETVSEEIEKLIEEIRLVDDKFKAEHEVFFYRPALEISKDSTIVKTVSAAYQKVLNKRPKFAGVGGWMDSALLTEAGIPTIIFGPKGAGAHAAVEYVDFDSVVKTTEILINTIINFCCL
jgi:acetylornithine deacetylase